MSAYRFLTKFFPLLKYKITKINYSDFPIAGV